MKRSGRKSIRSLIPAVTFLLIVPAVLVVAYTTPEWKGELESLLHRSHAPWLLGALLSPLAIGFILQLASRRFWAWPFVYLTAIYLAPGSLNKDPVDQAYHYASGLALIVTIAVAETLGLLLGRWLHRIVGIAYFSGATVWLLAQGLSRLWRGEELAWHGWTFVLAGILFLVQAVVQFVNYRIAMIPADADTLQESREPIETPGLSPTANEGAAPWKVQVELPEADPGTDISRRSKPGNTGSSTFPDDENNPGR